MTLLGVGCSIIVHILIYFINMLDNNLIIRYINDSQEFTKNMSLIQSIFIICIFGPIFEEIVFRKILMKICLHFMRFKYANIIQAIIFGFNNIWFFIIEN